MTRYTASSPCSLVPVCARYQKIWQYFMKLYTTLCKTVRRVAAFGCEPLVAPPGVWMRISSDLRSDDGGWSSMASMTAVFRCNDSEQAWHLLCRGTRWIGHVGNCTPTSLSSFSWRKFAHYSYCLCGRDDNARHSLVRYDTCC